MELGLVEDVRVKEVDNDVMRVVELLVEVLDVEVLLVLGDDVLLEGVKVLLVLVLGVEVEADVQDAVG